VASNCVCASMTQAHAKLCDHRRVRRMVEAAKGLEKLNPTEEEIRDKLVMFFDQGIDLTENQLRWLAERT
jgi:hypothetical protein